MGTSHSHRLDMPPGWPVTVVSSGPVAASRWISIGAPGPVSRPMTRTVPPGCTLGFTVVSETGATQAHAPLRGTRTANAAAAPNVRRRRNGFIRPPWSYLTAGATLQTRLPTLVVGRAYPTMANE